MNAADTRPVPTNLASWPGVSDLVLDYKLLLFLLWSANSKTISSIGVGGPGVIEHLMSSTTLGESVVLDALREFDRRRLIVLDEETREVGIRRWLRVHKFSGRWASAAEAAFAKVESAKIRGVWVKDERVREIFPPKRKPDQDDSQPAAPEGESSDCAENPSGGVNALFPTKTTPPAPNSNSNSNSNEDLLHARAAGGAQPAACGGAMREKNDEEGWTTEQNPASRAGGPSAPPVGNVQKRKQVVAGVECWSRDEVDTVSQLVQTHGAEAVSDAAKKTAEGGRKPLLSYVSNVLKEQKNENCNANFKRSGVGQQSEPGDPLTAAAERSRLRRAAAAGV